MLKLIADLHTHTIASGHAYGTIRENAQAAAEQGMKILGITEHAPGVPGTCDDFYFINLKVIPRRLYGVQMLFGCEVNVLNDGTLSLKEERMAKIDYAIAGMHAVCYEDAGRKKNTENLINCIKHPKIKFVSHPDDDHLPLDYDLLVPAAKEYGVALEVNNSSLLKPESRLNCFENYHTMLDLCMKYRVPIIINSDAHDPFYVGKLQRAIDLVQKENFDESLILNRSVEQIWKHFEIPSEKTTATDPDMGI